MKTVRGIEVSLEAMEKYAKKAFGLTVKLTEEFDFSAVFELLGSVQWTSVLPVFIPKGVDNRQAVDSLVIAGHKKPHGEVMKYKKSEAFDKHQLYFIENSSRPNVDTMGEWPGELVRLGKLWLPLKGYAVAQGLYNQITGEYLDPGTLTWFPGETLQDGEAAQGHFNSTFGFVSFPRSYSICGNGNGEARLAIPVPLRKS